MEQSLKYVREVLAGHIDREEVGRNIYLKITKNQYKTERDFVMDLSEGEARYLDQVLKEAIDYSKQSQDYERAEQLSDVYQILFV